MKILWVLLLFSISIVHPQCYISAIAYAPAPIAEEDPAFVFHETLSMLVKIPLRGSQTRIHYLDDQFILDSGQIEWFDRPYPILPQHSLRLDSGCYRYYPRYIESMHGVCIDAYYYALSIGQISIIDCVALDNKYDFDEHRFIFCFGRGGKNAYLVHEKRVLLLAPGSD